MMGTSHLTMTKCSVSNNAIMSANFPLLFADYFGKVSRDAWSGGVGSLGLDILNLPMTMSIVGHVYLGSSKPQFSGD
jgi:hypothetical protein